MVYLYNEFMGNNNNIYIYIYIYNHDINFGVQLIATL